MGEKILLRKGDYEIGYLVMQYFTHLTKSKVLGKHTLEQDALGNVEVILLEIRAL